MKKSSFSTKIISSIIIFTFISTSAGYSYETAKSTLRVPMRFGGQKTTKINEGYITKPEHADLRKWLETNKARNEKNRRRDLEKLSGLSGLIEVYLVSDLPIVGGHYAIRDRVIYLGDAKDLKEELYELLAITKEGVIRFGSQKAQKTIVDQEPKDLDGLIAWFKRYYKTVNKDTQDAISQKMVRFLENRKNAAEAAKLIVAFHNNAPHAISSEEATEIGRLRDKITEAVTLFTSSQRRIQVNMTGYSGGEPAIGIINKEGFQRGQQQILDVISMLEDTGNLPLLYLLRERLRYYLDRSNVLDFYEDKYYAGSRSAGHQIELVLMDSAIARIATAFDHPVRGAVRGGYFDPFRTSDEGDDPAEEIMKTVHGGRHEFHSSNDPVRKTTPSTESKKPKTIEVISIAKKYPLADKLTGIIKKKSALSGVVCLIDSSLGKKTTSILYHQAINEIDAAILQSQGKLIPSTTNITDNIPENLTSTIQASPNAIFIVVTGDKKTIQELKQEEKTLAKNNSRLLILQHPQASRGSGTGAITVTEHLDAVNPPIEKIFEEMDIQIQGDWEAALDSPNIFTKNLRREDVAKQLKSYGGRRLSKLEKREFEGLIRTYSIKDMALVPDHYGIRRMRVYVDDKYNDYETTLYARHASYELLNIIKYVYSRGGKDKYPFNNTLQGLLNWWKAIDERKRKKVLADTVDWLDKEGDPLEVWNALYRIHQNAPAVPGGNKTDIKAHFGQIRAIRVAFDNLKNSVGNETGESSFEIQQIVDSLVDTGNLEILMSMKEYLNDVNKSGSDAHRASNIVDGGIALLMKTHGRIVRGKADDPTVFGLPRWLGQEITRLGL